MPKRYTLEEIEAIPGNILRCKHIAAAIGSSECGIRLATQTAEGRAALGFPCVRVGSHTYFPKTAFLRFMRGEIRQVNYIIPNPRSTLPPWGFGDPEDQADPEIIELLNQLGKKENVKGKECA